MRKEIILIGVLFVIVSCIKPQPITPPHSFDTNVNEVLNDHEKQCNDIGTQIKTNCMQVSNQCFQLKEEYDYNRCGLE